MIDTDSTLLPIYAKTDLACFANKTLPMLFRLLATSRGSWPHTRILMSRDL
jgi:hypothetical protein